MYWGVYVLIGMYLSVLVCIRVYSCICVLIGMHWSILVCISVY